MKLKAIVFLILFFSLLGCGNIKPGVYKSTCVIYHVPQLILILNENKTFEYKRPYLDEKIIGTWEVNEKKELILKSKMFDSLGVMKPDYKFTENNGNDVYKVSGNKLLPYSEGGLFIKNKCHLIKISDDVKKFKDYKFFKSQ